MNGVRSFYKYKFRELSGFQLFRFLLSSSFPRRTITMTSTTARMPTTNDRHDAEEEEKRDECSVKPTDWLFGTRPISSFGAFAPWTRTSFVADFKRAPLSRQRQDFSGKIPRKIARRVVFPNRWSKIYCEEAKLEQGECSVRTFGTIHDKVWNRSIHLKRIYWHE